jgi:predicted RNase H-like HicB family nuclease
MLGAASAGKKGPQMSEKQSIVCVATGRADQWEAFCLDFDIAVQGRSFDEVRLSLSRAIDMYVDAALAEPEPIRSRLLERTAPFLVRLLWASRVFWSTLSVRATRRDSNPATVEFIACPA